MKLKTKYKIGDRVKYKDSDYIDKGICKCCNSSLVDIEYVKLKGVINNINIRVEKNNISIEYEINSDLIDEKQIIKKIK